MGLNLSSAYGAVAQGSERRRAEKASLEELLFRRQLQQAQLAMQQQQLEQQAKQFDQRLSADRNREGLDQMRFDANLMRDDADRQERKDAALTAQRQTVNLAGLKRMGIDAKQQGVPVADINDMMWVEGADQMPVPKPTIEEEARRAGALADATNASAARYRAPSASSNEQDWVVRDGVPTPIPRGTARPGDRPYNASGQGRVLGTERAALNYYNRGKQANDAIVQGGYEERYAKAGLGTQLQGQMPNVMQTREQQTYRQAQRAFTEARLRKESGAAVPQSEYDNDAATYFAQPGDSAETIAQKRATRQAVLDGIAFQAGGAYEEFYGEPLRKNTAGVDGGAARRRTVGRFQVVEEP
jgi:hypothetical protein